MSLVRWNTSIKQFTLNQIGKYARSFRLKAVLNEVSLCIEEDKIDRLSADKLKIIAKLVFAVMMNIDDKNVGNKVELETYLKTIQKENLALQSSWLNQLDWYINTIINFSSKNMQHDSSANFVSPPEVVVNVKVGLSIIHIAHAGDSNIGYLWISDGTSEHRSNIVCDAIMAIFSPIPTQCVSLDKLRKEDLSCELKEQKHSFFPSIPPTLTDPHSLRGTISKLLERHDLVSACLPQMTMDLIYILIVYLEGELPPLREDRYSCRSITKR